MTALAIQLWVVPLAIAWAALVGLPLRARERELSASDLGLLRRGRRAAVATAVLELHSEGLVEVRSRGDLARGRSPMRSGFADLPRSVYAALVVPVSLRGLKAKVRRALAAATAGLAHSGLVPGRTRWLLARAILLVAAAVATIRLVDGSEPAAAVFASAIVAGFIPRRTVAGRRALRRLRREHAELLSVPAWTPRQVAVGYGLTGRLPSALRPLLRRVRSRHLSFGGMDLGDGVSAGHGGGMAPD